MNAAGLKYIRRRLRCNVGLLLGGCASLLLFTGCGESFAKLNMYDQPRYEPLEASDFFEDGMASRPLVEGTIARGQLRDDEPLYTGKQDGKFVEQLPIELDETVLARGRQRFNIYCSPCHGLSGAGDGMIVQRGFSRPPSYHIDRLRNAPVGHFYDVMTNGFGAMRPYNMQIDPHDRWAIVAYIRALQLSQNATLDDLTEEHRAELQEAKP